MARDLFINGILIHEDGSDDLFINGVLVKMDQAAAGGDGGFTATALSLTAALQGIPVAANKTLELTL